MTLKREIKDAYLEGGNSIYVKTHSNAVYVDENETETLTQRLDNVKDSIKEHTSQLNNCAKNIENVILNISSNGIDDTVQIQEAINKIDDTQEEGGEKKILFNRNCFKK